MKIKTLAISSALITFTQFCHANIAQIDESLMETIFAMETNPPPCPLPVVVDCVIKSSGAPCTPAQTEEACDVDYTLVPQGQFCKTFGQKVWAPGPPAKPDTCGKQGVDHWPTAGDKCVDATPDPCAINIQYNCETGNLTFQVADSPTFTQCMRTPNGNTRADTVTVVRKTGNSGSGCHN